MSKVSRKQREDVHFTKKGSEFLGEALAASIEAQLPASPLSAGEGTKKER